MSRLLPRRGVERRPRQGMHKGALLPDQSQRLPRDGRRRLAALRHSFLRAARLRAGVGTGGLTPRCTWCVGAGAGGDGAPRGGWESGGDRRACMQAAGGDVVVMVFSSPLRLRSLPSPLSSTGREGCS